MPRCHRCIASKSSAAGRKNRYVYTYNEAQMRSTRAALERKGRKVKGSPQRYKGLGEMDADQLADTTAGPRSDAASGHPRQAEEAARIAEGVDLLMGNDVRPRKDFIVESAKTLDRERIDA